jgi:hypothetical protein
MQRFLTSTRDAIKRVLLTVKHVEPNTGRTTRRRVPPTRTVDEGVRIEYSPRLDGDPDPGEVVWTWVPFEDDPTLGKDRPVVIIGRHGASLSGVALTSKDKHRSDQVPVGSGSWDPKHRSSYAKIDRLLDVVPAEVRREGAVLDRARFDALVSAVEGRHDIVPIPSHGT